MSTAILASINRLCPKDVLEKMTEKKQVLSIKSETELS